MSNTDKYVRTSFRIRLHEFDGSTMYVEVTDSPFGRMRQPEIVHFNPELLLYLNKLGTPSQNGRMSKDELVVMGQMIGDLLLPTRVRRLFFRTFEKYYNIETEDKEGLRILLELDDAQLGLIPWEYVYIREFQHFSSPDSQEDMKGFLGLEDYISIIRFEPYVDEIQKDLPEYEMYSVSNEDKINILFCGANPYDFSELNLVHEFDDLNLEKEERFRVIKAQNVHKKTIKTKLGAKEPTHIFHFSGHAGYLPRSAVSPEGQIYVISAKNHQIDEKPSEEDRIWERRFERLFQRNTPDASAVMGTTGDLRGLKHVIDPSRGLKHVIDPSRGLKHVIDPSRGLKHVIDPSRGLSSSVYDSLDRKEGALLLEQRFNTHNWQNQSFNGLKRIIRDEKKNIEQARHAGLEPANPFLDFLKFIMHYMENLSPSELKVHLKNTKGRLRKDLLLNIRDEEPIILRLKYLSFLLSKYLPDETEYEPTLFPKILSENFPNPSPTPPPNILRDVAEELFGADRLKITEKDEATFKKNHQEAWNKWYLPGAFWANTSGMPHETRRTSLRWRQGSHAVLWASELPEILAKDQKISLVVLNSCQTSQSDSRYLEAAGVATTLIQAGIPAVIGMQLGIDDESAKNFSSVFYNELSKGKPIEVALKTARQAMARKGNHQSWGIPTLYMKNLDVANNFRLVTSSPSD